jgi:hypothetical protein
VEKFGTKIVKFFFYWTGSDNLPISNINIHQTTAMKEELLHYVWRMHRFDLAELVTTQGEKVEILDFGEYNRHGGPDFFNVRIRIGETLWAGNVEMHLKASEWLRHGHQEDRAYDNVILHVVLDEDERVFRANGEPIPCLELRRRIPGRLSKTYRKLLHSEYWIPCQYQFYSVPEVTRDLWLDRLLVERLEHKTDAIARRLKDNRGDWEETFYQCLAMGFGLRINVEPFEQLSRSLPLKLLTKHRNNLFQIEALLFGQSGLLEQSFLDDYPQRLKKEYDFLAGKYGLIPLSAEQWKFLRLRPANFPTLRLAQLASLVYSSTHLVSKALAAESLIEIANMFNLKLSHYWYPHYVFDKISPKREKKLGRATIELIVINVIAPFLFLYGQHKAEERFKDQAVRLLEEIPSERNHLLDRWKELGLNPVSAYQTQALIQLKNEYCDKKKCLECAIGNAILGQV